MAEGEQMTFNTADYPELEGLKEGDMVKKITHMDSRVVGVSDGQVTVEGGPCQIETEGMADKEYKRMRADGAMGMMDGGMAMAGGGDGEEEDAY